MNHERPSATTPCPYCDGGRKGTTCEDCCGAGVLPMPPASWCRRCGYAAVVNRVCGWCNDSSRAGDQPPRRAFSVTHEAWYFGKGLYMHWPEARIVAEVMFGLDCPGGGTLGQMGMRWHRHGSSTDATSTATPRLEVFCDAWVILARFSDVVAALAERDSMKTRHNMTPEEFVELLKTHGFLDTTQRKPPPEIE